MSEAIPTEVVSPQFRGWSCRMKESAESGQGHLQLLCAQHFPLGCQRPNNLFTKKKLVISAVPGCLELKLNTHTKHTHTQNTHNVQGHPPPNCSPVQSPGTPLFATCPFPIAPRNLPICYSIDRRTSPQSISLPHPEITL